MLFKTTYILEVYKMNEFETFYGEIREQQTGLMVITIPKKLMEFSGWKEGDMLKVMAKKKEEQKKK